MENERREEMNHRQQNFAELIQAGISASDADAFQRISRSLHKLDESLCNGFVDWRGNWDEAAEMRAEKRSNRLEGKATELAQKYGFIAYHQSDPRGWSLYLVKPDQLGQYSIDAIYNRGIGVTPH